MSKHIGIVACSAGGAALCYQTICEEGAALMGPHAHPEISLHTFSLADYVSCLNENDWKGVSDLMLASATKLAKVGADFLICPDNTIHKAFEYMRDSPLPWLHIAEVVSEKASQLGFKRLGLTGTKWLVESDTYPEKLAQFYIQCIRPTEEEIQSIDHIIMQELVYGILKPESVEYFQQLVENFKCQQCDAVILGCTEIPLIINSQNSVLPVLDSTRLLARKALQNSLEKT